MKVRVPIPDVALYAKVEIPSAWPVRIALADVV